MPCEALRAGPKEGGKGAHGLRQTSCNVWVAWKQLSMGILLSLGKYRGIQANFVLLLGFVALFVCLFVFVSTKRLVLHYIMIFACMHVMTKPLASVS